MITDPLVKHVIQVNKSVIELAANESSGLEPEASMIVVSYHVFVSRVCDVIQLFFVDLLWL